MKTAIVLGATGLIGNGLLKILLQSREYSKVITFSRKEINIKNEKLEQYCIDFDRIEKYKENIKGDDFFCCIGTTLRKAKTRENFTKVDFTYPSVFAEIARNNGVQKFLLVSSIGSNAQSGNYYLKTKGLLEEKVKELKFSGAFIFRPSFLSGKRNEFRWGEKLGTCIFSVFSVFLIGKLKKYKPVDSEQVAKSMYRTAQKNLSGNHIYESDEIQEL